MREKKFGGRRPVTEPSAAPKVVIGIVLGLVVGVFATYIITNNINKKSAEKVTTTTIAVTDSTPSTPGSSKNEELSYADVKDLRNKLGTIFYGGTYADQYPASATGMLGAGTTLDAVAEGTLTNRDKAAIATKSIPSVQYEPVYDGNGIIGYNISDLAVLSRLQELFGDENTAIDLSGDSIVYCAPNTDQNGKVTLFIGCGGASPSYNVFRILSYTLSGDTATIELAVGSVAPDNLEGTPTQYIVYNDRAGSIAKTEVQRYPAETFTQNYAYSYTIDAANTDKFTHYNVNFKRQSNGNFAFANMTKK